MLTQVTRHRQSRPITPRLRPRRHAIVLGEVISPRLGEDQRGSSATGQLPMSWSQVTWGSTGSHRKAHEPEMWLSSSPASSCALGHECSPARLCSFRFRAAPALLALAADAGAFAALGGQHVGVAGVGITPAQVVLQLRAIAG